MASSFESRFPAITRWVKEFGTIEIGHDAFVENFVKALDRGGMPWGGRDEYETVDEALEDLERGIGVFLKEQGLDQETARGRRASRRVAKMARKSTDRSTRPDQMTPRDSGAKRDRSKKQPFEDKVRKLEEMADALRGGEHFEITRLTMLKGLCQDAKAAGAFALFLTRQVRKVMREKESAQRYRTLTGRAVRELGPYLKHPTEDRRERLASLLHEMQDEQNEYKPMKWGNVRIIKSMDLLVAEKALRAVLRPDAAPYWLYQAAREYAERYDARYGTGLIPKSAPMVEEIARFWRKYFGIRR